MLRAAIFDLDGLLIDSEPLWRRAEMEVFAGVGLALTDEMCATTTGLRLDAVVEHWFERAPWEGRSRADVTAAIAARVAALIAAEAPILPGVEQALSVCERRGLPLALCSSSPTPVIDAGIARLGLAARWRVVCSAEGEPYGKPHPAVYLRTAERLGVPPERCLAFEDSLNGAIAAKAARMRVVAVPASGTRFDFCDARLPSLARFDEGVLAELDR